jgi:hypothetical protein
LHARWKWDEERFVPIIAPSDGAEVEILDLRRSDRPTRYEVHSGGECLWATSSRAWALLFGYSLNGRAVFSATGSRWLLRHGRAQVYLPSPLGRWLVAQGNPTPGPITGPDGRPTYSYTFSSEADRSSALALLWNHVRASRLGGRLSHLMTIARRETSAPRTTSAYLPPSLIDRLTPHCAPDEVAQLSSLLVPPALIPHFSNLVPQ